MKKLLSLLAGALLAISLTAALPAQSTKAPKSASTAAMPTASKPLDINTATVAQLKVLPGIGDVYAQKIVDGRKAKPYSGKDDLVNNNIIPQATYDKIKDIIIAKQPKTPQKK